MSAQILNLAAARASAFDHDDNWQRQPETQLQSVAVGGEGLGATAATPNENQKQRFKFWSGASKERYVHTIYPLFDCPDLPAANYMLVRRNENGERSVLEIGHTHEQSSSENLAKVRHHAALLGANEVHVHYLPETKCDRALVELDLQAGQFGSLSAQPVSMECASAAH